MADMFTGIVTALGKVRSVSSGRAGLKVKIKRPAGWRVRPGDSVNVNGVCSTVTRSGAALEFEYMPETISRTNLGGLKAGDRVNLENSLRPSDLLSGHLVLGHVDAAGRLARLAPEGNSRIMTIFFPSKFARLIAPKGSLAVEGVSLTVVKVGRDSCTVKLIPYTLTHTNLGKKRTGDKLNLEFDVLAKYVARQLGK